MVRACNATGSARIDGFGRESRKRRSSSRRIILKLISEKFDGGDVVQDSAKRRATVDSFWFPKIFGNY